MKKIFTEELSQVTTDEVRTFWQANPLCVSGNPFDPGSLDFFKYYDKQREEIESIEYSYVLHEYPNFSGKKVLDVGSGNGYVLAKYALEGADVYGIDITQAGVELCRKRFNLLNLNGDFRVADAQEIPFEDNSFDCVCSMGVLHHVPDTQRALDEIFRVLKPGGRLIVMFYYKHSAKYQFKYRIWSLFTGKTMQQLVNEFDGMGNPKGVVSSKSELRKRLSKFSQIEMNIGYLTNDDIILRGARFFPKNIFKHFESLIGWNLYAKAIKPS
jgi:ubiquinone/menaquinone biosynthesis C-methylase UbiE